MNFLVFAASLRKGSYNRKLALRASEALGRVSGVDVDHADFREFEMPMYDGDLEDASGIPAGGRKLVDRIRAATAVVISTPEYNGGIPGTLKNAIDWVSRDDENPIDGKPILLLGASPGALGAVRVLWHTRQPLEAQGAFVYPEMLGVPRAAQAFTETGEFTDPKQQARLESLLQDFAAWVARIAPTR